MSGVEGSEEHEAVALDATLAPLPNVLVTSNDKKKQLRDCRKLRQEVVGRLLSLNSEVFSGVWDEVSDLVYSLQAHGLTVRGWDDVDRGLHEQMWEKMQHPSHRMDSRWLALSQLYLLPFEFMNPEDVLRLDPDVMEEFCDWALALPSYDMRVVGEVESYTSWKHDVLKHVVELGMSEPDQWVKSLVLKTFRSLAGYMAQTVPAHDVMSLLGVLTQQVHGANSTDPSASGVGVQSGGHPRFGCVLQSLNRSTETRAAIPVCWQQKRRGSAVTVFAVSTDCDVADWVREHIGEVVVLPKDWSLSASCIRNREIDTLHFASNMTWGCGEMYFLASQRLARRQQVNFAHPHTTGAKHIDVFQSGEFMKLGPEPENRFTERLETVPKSGISFAFFGLHSARPALAPPKGRVRFVSGCNLNKIVPETIEVWCQILHRVPNSELVLYPFGPAWQARYPQHGFAHRMQTLTGNRNLEGRILVLDRFGTLDDLRMALGHCHVYLDGFPYSGATSLLDPLERGVPPVVCEGIGVRFSQGAAFLRELGLAELVASDAAGLVDLAERLATDRSYWALQSGRSASQFAAWRSSQLTIEL